MFYADTVGRPVMNRGRPTAADRPSGPHPPFPRLSCCSGRFDERRSRGVGDLHHHEWPLSADLAQSGWRPAGYPVSLAGRSESPSRQDDYVGYQAASGVEHAALAEAQPAGDESIRQRQLIPSRPL